MERTPHGPRASNWFAAAAIALALGLVLVLVLLVTGALLDSADDLVTVFLAGVAVVALTGWWQDKAARAERDRAAAAEREQADRDRHDEHMREMKTRARLERAHTAERQWAHELRNQVARLHREQGALGHTGDVREMVLETAVQLVDAERGLLLSRRDEDGDGDFDMACQTGFEHDATHSAVAQEYAGKVLRRDETVREDDSRELRGEGRNPADDEIDNLLAIPIFIQDDFEGVVLCANREGGFEDLDDDVLLALGDHAGAVLENGRLQGEMRSTYMAIVRMLAEAIEAKDPATRLHSEDVAEYVRAVADGLGLEAAPREELLIASLLHDVGKIGVSERILLKPGPLTPDERAAIELHARIGYHLVRQVPALHGIAEAVLHHHERWDGAGLPRRAGRRRDPAGRPRDQRGRRVQRHDVGPPLPRGHGRRGGLPRAGALRGRPVRPARGGPVRGAGPHAPARPPRGRRAGGRAGRPRGAGPAGAGRARGGLRAHRRRGQPDAAVRPPPPARAGRPPGRGVDGGRRALLRAAGGADRAVRDQRARGLRRRRPGHRATSRAWCPTWPPRCTGPRAGTAGAGWPSWRPPSPARPRPRWAATWSAPWRRTGPSCARQAPSGARATRRPRRSSRARLALGRAR